MTSITSLGLGSGLDLESLVSQLVAAEGQPEQLRISQTEANYQAEMSALGSFRSALDSFNTALDNLSSLDSFNKRTASSSNEGLFTVTADANAVQTAHDVEVVNLAQGHKLSSNAFTAADTAVGTGTLNITVGDQTMALNVSDGSNTLTDIRDAINNAENNPGVSAVIVNGEDGAHLVLSSTDTGTASAITITTTGGDGGLSALAYDPTNGVTNMTEVQAAVDAEINVDGITVHSSSNSVTNAIDGVTINLVSASPGETARLTVALDTTAAMDAIKGFVSAYNSLQQTLNGMTAYDPTTKIAGPLLGDSMVLMFDDQLRRDIGDPVSGVSSVMDTLGDIGITTNFDDGTLVLDEDVLGQAIQDNFDQVGQLFASQDGVGVRLQSLAKSYLDTDGLISVRTDGLQTSIDGLADDQNALNDHLNAYEARLRDQFTALDQLVTELTSTSQFLAQQLAMLPTTSTTPTGA